MSGNRQPGGDPDDIFADFAPPPTPNTQKGVTDSRRGGANNAQPTPDASDNDAFVDIPAGPTAADRAPVSQPFDDEDPDTEADEEPKKGNSILSKAITYGGTAALILGGGFLVESQMGLSRLILGEPEPPAITQPAPAQPPVGPRAAAPNTPPDPQNLRLPPPTVQPPSVSLPNQQTQSGAPPVGINRQPQLGANASGGATPLPPSQIPTPPQANAVNMNIPQPAATLAPSMEIQVALNSAVDRMQDNQREAQRQVALGLQTGLNQIAMSVMTRFDRFEGRMDIMRTTIEGINERMGALEVKFAALEAVCVTPPSVASATPPQPAAGTPASPAVTAGRPAPVATPNVRQPTAPATAAPTSPAMPSAQPQAAAPAVRPEPAAPAPAARSITGWSLRGVSQNAALLQTPTGQMQRVELGEDVSGIGKVQEIRREGDSFVLITTRGAIRP